MDYIKLMRPAQWSKNIFVFLPLFFAQSITDMPRLVACIVAFAVMCLVSSSIYILNDIMDVKYDRLHPQKSQRPIASGRVPVPAAWCMHILLLVPAVAVVVFAMPHTQLAAVLGIYLLINYLYSFGLKHIAIVDVLIVALGFVLRIVVGAVAADVSPSHWIIIMTFLLALFLVMTKRRDDVLKYENEQTTTRHNVRAYNKPFLDNAITLVAAVTLVSYIMYTVDADVVQRFECDYVYATSIFVLAGILRYLQLTLVEERSWSPTYIVAHDRFLQCCIVGWVILFGIIIYG